MEHLVAPDAARTAGLVAAHIAELSREAIAARGYFAVALAAAPELELVYKLLAARKDIDWKRWEFFFAEERAVSTEDEDSACHMVTEHLLSRLRVREEKIRPMFSLGLDVTAAAEDYSAQLTPLLGDPPVFDLVLLTLGRNAEVLGLFPLCPALADPRPVAGVSDAPMSPPGDRVTLTPVALRAARNLLLVAFGSRHARALRMVLDDEDDRLRVPGQVIRDAEGTVTLALDEQLAMAIGLRG